MSTKKIPYQIVTIETYIQAYIEHISEAKDKFNKDRRCEHIVSNLINKIGSIMESLYYQSDIKKEEIDVITELKSIQKIIYDNIHEETKNRLRNRELVLLFDKIIEILKKVPTHGYVLVKVWEYPDFTPLVKNPLVSFEVFRLKDENMNMYIRMKQADKMETEEDNKRLCFIDLTEDIGEEPPRRLSDCIKISDKSITVFRETHDNNSIEMLVIAVFALNLNYSLDEIFFKSDLSFDIRRVKPAQRSPLIQNGTGQLS